LLGALKAVGHSILKSFNKLYKKQMVVLTHDRNNLTEEQVEELFHSING